MDEETGWGSIEIPSLPINCPLARRLKHAGGSPTAAYRTWPLLLGPPRNRIHGPLLGPGICPVLTGSCAVEILNVNPCLLNWDGGRLVGQGLTKVCPPPCVAGSSIEMTTPVRHALGSAAITNSSRSITPFLWLKAEQMSRRISRLLGPHPATPRRRKQNNNKVETARLDVDQLNGIRV